MKKLQSQLKTISKTLTKLSDQIEKISEQVTAAPAPKKPAKAVKPAKKRKVAAPKAKKVSKKTKAAPAADTAQTGTVLEGVFNVIKKNKNGISIEALKAQTKLQARQLSNALYKLTKKGMIEARSRGVYFKK